MRLQVHLLNRIAATGLACWLATAGLLLYRSDHQARHDARATAEAMRQQLELQLIKWGATLGLRDPFPDLQSWQPNTLGIGDCVVFGATEAAAPRQFCNGLEPETTATPPAFAWLYRTLFSAGQPVALPVSYRNRRYGTVTVIPSAQRELVAAWADVSSLTTLAALMVFSVCALVYWSVSRALAPSARIVAGLEAMRNGNLAVRLPAFELNEWRSIAGAVNQLAAVQQQLLEERQALAVKLMNLQEEERRDLARELHDEFGQCLTGINALTASITQGARDRCPDLVDEAQRIGDITQRLLAGIRGLLRRLRPAELDEVGLQSSLESLAADWNRQGRTRYDLSIDGDCSTLPDAVTVALFRVVQECLTNIAKHAEARHARIALTVGMETAILIVADDGLATRVPQPFGIGLLGMRERVSALHGRMALRIAEPHGLIVTIQLPLEPESTSAT